MSEIYEEKEPNTKDPDDINARKGTQKPGEDLMNVIMIGFDKGQCPFFSWFPFSHNSAD